MKIKFSLQKTPLEKIRADALALALFEDKKLSQELEKLDKILGGLLKSALKEEFEGKEGEILSLHTHGKISAKKIIIAGLGKKKEFNSHILQNIGIAIVKAAKASKAKILAIAPFEEENIPSLVEGVVLGNYEFKKYYSKKEKEHLKKIIIIAEVSGKNKEAVETAAHFAQATNFARDLVNEPASHLSPYSIVQEAKKIKRHSPGISLKILDKRSLKKIGAGGILSVAEGSDQPPYLVHLSYKPQGAKKRIVLVGKGLTFDSGGISLKPADKMMEMKIDMAGAAVVLGVFSALKHFKPKVEVHGIIPTCENMPSGKALRPGDVIKTLSGKTVEVLNTDVEGRIVLADGLTYGAKLKPDLMIDLATLTGACIVALGDEIAGLMVNEAKVAELMGKVSEKTGEKFWLLPLPKEYKEGLKSEIADLNNIGFGKGKAVTITGGLFLEEFVENIPWAHLDIAGPVWKEKEGATGFGVRTIVELIRSL